jgi:hypothetical protein
MRRHTDVITARCYASLRQLSAINRYTSPAVMQSLTTSLVLSRLYLFGLQAFIVYRRCRMLLLGWSLTSGGRSTSSTQSYRCIGCRLLNASASRWRSWHFGQSMACVHHMYMHLSDYPGLDVLVCVQRRRTASWSRELILRSAVGHFRSLARKFGIIYRHLSLPPSTSAFSVLASRHFCFISPTPDLLYSSPACCALYSVWRLLHVIPFTFSFVFCLLSPCLH